MSTIVDGLEAGKTYYARETDLAYATWAVRLISPSAFDVPSGSDYGRATFTTLNEDKAYTVYEQAGGSPAAVDVPVAFLAVDVLAAIVAKTDLITPSRVTSRNRIESSGATINVLTFLGETTLDEPFDVDTDYRAVPLEIVFEIGSQYLLGEIATSSEIARVADSGLTKTVDSVQLNTIPLAVRSTPQRLNYSCRVVATGQKVFGGVWTVAYEAD